MQTRSTTKRWSEYVRKESNSLQNEFENIIFQARSAYRTKDINLFYKTSQDNFANKIIHVPDLKLWTVHNALVAILKKEGISKDEAPNYGLYRGFEKLNNDDCLWDAKIFNDDSVSLQRTWCKY
jgi:hypothetical protein